jgi:hypothetical protein
MMEVICSSEIPVLTRATRRHIPDDGILHSHRSGNLKSYILYNEFRYSIFLCDIRTKMQHLQANKYRPILIMIN